MSCLCKHPKRESLKTIIFVRSMCLGRCRWKTSTDKHTAMAECGSVVVVLKCLLTLYQQSVDLFCIATNNGDGWSTHGKLYIPLSMIDIHQHWAIDSTSLFTNKVTVPSTCLAYVIQNHLPCKRFCFWMYSFCFWLHRKWSLCVLWPFKIIIIIQFFKNPLFPSNTIATNIKNNVELFQIICPPGWPMWVFWRAWKAQILPWWSLFRLLAELL